MEIINAVGRRKASVARIVLKPGKGNITINKATVEQYSPLDFTHNLIKQPLQRVEVVDRYDIKINVQGGGFKGQAEAIRLGIARALCQADSSFRPELKKEGFLTRDPRVVERKKPGLKKARKRFQFTKR
jgi:small subunit ribosomal protein S9